MNTPLQQSKGSNAVLQTKYTISKIYGINSNEVLYLKTNSESIENYKLCYNSDSEKAYWVGDAGGNVQSYSAEGSILNIITSTGTYNLEEADANKGITSIESYGAVNDKTINSSYAFTNSLSAEKGIYIPDGDFYTSVYDKFSYYGDGNVYGTYAGDGLYNDNGRRIVNSFNKDNFEPLFFNVNTRGNYERGAGLSLLMNMPDGRTQVSGYNDDSRQSSYVNHDAVGMYIGASGPTNQNTVTNCTFTATTCYSADFTEEMNNSIEPGMFCITSGGTRYGARILSYDSTNKLLTVSGWYASGDSSSGQIPTAGLSVITNDVSKIWGQNTVVYIRSQSNTSTATGYELGFQMSTKAPGTPIWGFHSVNYSTLYSGDRAFYASGKWGFGYHASGTVGVGYNQDIDTSSNTTIGFRIQNLTNSSYTGSVLQYNTNYRDNTSKFIEILSGGVSQWSISTNGTRSAIRERYTVISSNTTLTSLSNSILLCTNTSNITINTGNIPIFSLIVVASMGTGSVTITNSAGTSIKNVAPKESITLLYDGTYLNNLTDNKSSIESVIATSNIISGSSASIVRYRGNVNSSFTFDTTNMVAGQRFSIFNDSTSSNTISITASSTVTLNTNGSADFFYDGSALRCMSLYNPS